MKKSLSVLLVVVIIFSVFPLSALAAAEEDYQSLYKPVLDMFYENISNNSWPYAYTFAAPVGYNCYSYAADDPYSVASQIMGFDGLSSVGYQMTDMNGDGILELIIARNNVDFQDICDVYTISADGKVLHLASDCDDGNVTEGHYYDVNTTGQIIGSFGSGAVGTSDEIYAFNADSTGLDLVAVINEYWDEGCYYYTEQVSGYSGWLSLDRSNMNEITRDEYTALTQQMSLQLTLFSDYSSANGENTGNTEELVWNGHNYKLFDLADEIDTWAAAEQYCEEQGGHLATLTSAEENEAVYEFMCGCGYESAYFGLTDCNEEGNWAWITGETLSYTNWHSNEPNQENSNEDYGMFYYKYTDATWNDGDFGSGGTNGGGRAFLCEWDNGVSFETDTEPTLTPEPTHTPVPSESDGYVVWFDQSYSCVAGETINITASCYSETVPSADDFMWGPAYGSIVSFGDTSIMGPAETGEENLYWVSVPVTALNTGKIAISLDLTAGYSGDSTVLTVTQEGWDADRDQWSFSNSSYYYSQVSNGYYITGSDYRKLLSNLSNMDLGVTFSSEHIHAETSKYNPFGWLNPNKNILDNTLEQSNLKTRMNVDGTSDSGTYVEWGGSCFGMSAIACLVYDDVLESTDFYSSSEVLHEMPFNSQIASTVNFYQMQQYLSLWENSIRDFMEKTQSEQLVEIENMVSAGTPILFAFAWYDLDAGKSAGHTTVIYGMGDDGYDVTVNNQNYHFEKCFYVYDCAYPDDDRYNIYYTVDSDGSGTSRWAIEGWGIVSVDNEIDEDAGNNGEICVATNDIGLLNAVSYVDGALSESMQYEYVNSPRIHTFIEDFMIGLDSETVNVSDMVIEKKNSGIALYDQFGYAIGEDNLSEATVFLPESTDYSFKTDETVDFTFADTDIYSSVQSETSGTATFDSSGAAVLDADEQAQCMLLMRDYGSNVSWTDTLVSGAASYISAEYYDGGVLISGEDLQNAEVTISRDSSSVSEDLPDGSSTLLLKIDESDGAVHMYEDPDGDGTYDYEYTDNRHTHTRGNEVTIVKEAGCTETGLRSYVCQTCGETVSNEVIPALGHSWGRTQITSESTCTNAGSGVSTCTRCGETKNVVLPLLNHTWDAGTVTKQPTLTGKGTLLRTCVVCGATKTEEINVIQTVVRGIPATGDKTQIMPYIWMITGGGAAIVVIAMALKYRRKKH